MTNTPDFLGRAAQTPGRVVVTMAGSGVQYTAGVVAHRALALAQWLAQRGLQPGERFAVLLENRIEIIELVLAARQAGLYAVVLNTHLSAAETAHIVRDSGARLAVASSRTWPQVADAVAERSLPCWSVDADTPGVAALEHELEALQSPEIDLSPRPLGRDLLYSSGTTGRPKGVLQPLQPASLRGQLNPEALGAARHMGFDTNTIYLSPAPLYHAAPLRYTMRVLELGGQVVIMSHFDPEQALALIERYHITHSQWVPTMLRRLLQLPAEVRSRHDLSSHRVAIHAASPCPPELKRAMLDWWGDILLEYYAGSEGCGTTLITSVEWRQRPGSVGRAISGEIHIVGDDGQELPAGEIGQVYFSGGGQFSYLGDEAKTRQAIDARGWATYGDIGHVDEAGYLYLSNRRVDLILSGGVNLYPAEIENALSSHADVSEVAVIGVPDPDLGEVPLAVVVLRPGAEASAATARAIVEQGAGALGRLKRPRRVVFADQLPRLETGKLLRRALKERYAAQPQAGWDVDAGAMGTAAANRSDA